VWGAVQALPQAQPKSFPPLLPSQGAALAPAGLR
jgi:hypothetical protein